MRSFGVYEAKNRLSELLELVASGEAIVITNHGRPVAHLSRPDGELRLARHQAPGSEAPGVDLSHA